MTKKTLHNLWIAALCIWTALVLYGSLAPGDDLPPPAWWVWIPGFDKIVHFLFYMGEVSLLILVFQPRNGLRWLIAGIAILCSGGIELLQGAYFERSKDIWDLASNSAGAISGVLISGLICKYLNPILLSAKGNTSVSETER